jgi:ABC-type Co2+ transport system permease subunit
MIGANVRSDFWALPAWVGGAFLLRGTHKRAVIDLAALVRAFKIAIWSPKFKLTTGSCVISHGLAK